MADINQLVPLIKRWEGGYADDPADLGGATNQGITLNTYRHYYGSGLTARDLQKMSESEWLHILRCGYWEAWQADHIDNQSIANLLVDWVWGSGTGTIARVQKLIGVTPDGKAGPKTLGALNRHPQPRALFNAIWQARLAYIDHLCQVRPLNKRFRRGWINRLNNFVYAPTSTERVPTSVRKNQNNQ